MYINKYIINTNYVLEINHIYILKNDCTCPLDN